MIILTGRTLFNDNFNLVMIGLHIVGVFATGMFLRIPSGYSDSFWIFIVAGAIPLAVETLSFFHSKFNYRSHFNS